jgi:protease-4
MSTEHPEIVLAPAPAPPQVVVYQQTMFGRFGRWLLAGLVLAVLVIFGLVGRYQSYFSPPDAPQEKYHSLSKTASKKIAIIRIEGPILDGDGFAKQQIDRVREDQDVVAVVLRVDSPGGTVTGSDYLLHHLQQLSADRRLPMVVSMGGICASGGYYVAMAVGDREDTIFAEPTTWTGSIGVVIPHYDLSDAMTYLNIKDDSLASGSFKQMGSPTRSMTDEERSLLQALVDDSFQGFKDVVISGRPKFKDDAASLDAVATGQIFYAKQALARGLVDRIGFIEAAIERAAELANYGTGDLRCVKYDRPPNLFGDIFESSARAPGAASRVDLSALLNLTTPRAYYLWSWLPAAMTNSRQ